MSEEITKNSFGIFRTSVIFGLKPAVQVVYSWLVYHANSKTGLCFPSIKLLSKECGTNRKVIMLSLKFLEEKGLINKEFSNGKVNNYTLTSPDLIPVNNQTSPDSTLVNNQTSPDLIPVPILHRSLIRTTPVPNKDRTSPDSTPVPVPNRDTNYKNLTRRSKLEEFNSLSQTNENKFSCDTDYLNNLTSQETDKEYDEFNLDIQDYLNYEAKESSKNLVSNNNSKKLNKKTESLSHLEIKDLYNKILGNYLSKISELSSKRKSLINARAKTLTTMEMWNDFFTSILERSFLLGENDKGWKADFDWILTESHFIKIQEGGYINKVKQKFDAKFEAYQEQFRGR